MHLNSAQRFWFLFAIAFLGSTIAVSALRWPRSDPAVVADLLATECAPWRDPQVLDSSVRPPDTGAQCEALHEFVVHERVVVRSVEEYDSYRLRTGITGTAVFLASWAAFVAFLYGLVWSSRRVINLLLNRNRPTAP
jgi:hypothetical protein